MSFVIMISEIFSTSFLFSIAICIILVGGLFAYFNYRFSEQNHKIQSMLGLVSTMAEEMQYFRSKLNGRQVDSSDGMDNIQIVPNFLGGNGNSKNMSENELIEVSDSEVEDDESEIEDDNDDDDNGDLEIEDDLDIDSDLDEDDEDNEDDENDDISVEDLDDTDTNKKIINIDLGTNNNDFVIESEEFNFSENHNDHVKNDANNDTNDETIKNINIDLDLSADELNLENMELSFKTISIDDNVSSKGKEDYKKMSLNKLRDVVCSKGLVVDASKLKKNELLKLLGDE
jgi:hypothetical protein